MTEKNTLNPQRFVTQIQKNPNFLKNLPRQDFQSMESNEFKRQRARAIQLGSYALADERIKDHGEYDLDANLFELIANTETFLHSSQTIEAFHQQYRSPRDAPRRAVDEYYDEKYNVTVFNHSLKEVINAGASKFNFNELLVFMTNINTSINGREQQQQFYDAARESLIGMRNEIAFEQILLAADIDYESGSIEDDAKGGDFIVNGTPIDVKASEFNARNAQKKAYRNGYDGSHIIWSQIDFEDFQGELVLSQDVVAKKVPAVQALVSAITQPQHAQNSR